MAKFDVYYMRSEWCRKGIEGHLPNVENLSATHTRIRKDHEASHPEDVWEDFQAECWSPNGEARPLIETLNLSHTSMTVGDLVVNKDTNEVLVVSNIGWRNLTEELRDIEAMIK